MSDTEQTVKLSEHDIETISDVSRSVADKDAYQRPRPSAAAPFFWVTVCLSFFFLLGYLAPISSAPNLLDKFTTLSDICVAKDNTKSCYASIDFLQYVSILAIIANALNLAHLAMYILLTQVHLKSSSVLAGSVLLPLNGAGATLDLVAGALAIAWKKEMPESFRGTCGWDRGADPCLPIEEAVGVAMPLFLAFGLVGSVLLLISNFYMIRALVEEEIQMQKVLTCEKQDSG